MEVGVRTIGETPLLGEMGEAQRGGPSPARNVPTVRWICCAGKRDLADRLWEEQAPPLQGVHLLRGKGGYGGAVFRDVGHECQAPSPTV